MNTHVHFAPGFASIEEVEAAYGPIWDATTLQKVADCPRSHEIKVEEHLDSARGPSAPMVAGIAVHAGLEYYYAHEVRDTLVEAKAISVMEEEFASFGLDRALVDPKYLHLTVEHLRQVMENYFHMWNHQRIEVFKPLMIRLEDLDLSKVVAAKFLTTEDGGLILGESSIVMRFEVNGDEFLLAGKPDLPVAKQDGSIYIMDHKTSSSYLSDYWASQFEVSNKMRGYMAMVGEMLHMPIAGAVINGIYVGKSATSPTSNAARCERYQFDFSPDHVDEAIRNQWAWRKTVEFYRDLGYFPQGCAYGGCSHPSLCRRDPASREVIKATDYQPSTRTFWSL